MKRIIGMFFMAFALFCFGLGFASVHDQEQKILAANDKEHVSVDPGTEVVIPVYDLQSDLNDVFPAEQNLQRTLYNRYAIDKQSPTGSESFTLKEFTPDYWRADYLTFTEDFTDQISYRDEQPDLLE
jgi:hypothetical protein